MRRLREIVVERFICVVFILRIDIHRPVKIARDIVLVHHPPHRTCRKKRIFRVQGGIRGFGIVAGVPPLFFLIGVLFRFVIVIRYVWTPRIHRICKIFIVRSRYHATNVPHRLSNLRLQLIGNVFRRERASFDFSRDFFQRGFIHAKHHLYTIFSTRELRLVDNTVVICEFRAIIEIIFIASQNEFSEIRLEKLRVDTRFAVYHFRLIRKAEV